MKPQGELQCSGLVPPVPACWNSGGAGGWHEVCQQLPRDISSSIPHLKPAVRPEQQLGLDAAGPAGLPLPAAACAGLTLPPRSVRDCPGAVLGLSSACVTSRGLLHFQQWVKVFLYIFCKMFCAYK